VTDDEIMSIMYDHATAFSRYIQFTDQGILDFARAILEADVPRTVAPEPEGYDAAMQTALDTAEKLERRRQS
jgi:hypothetical protein